MMNNNNKNYGFVDTADDLAFATAVDTSVPQNNNMGHQMQQPQWAQSQQQQGQTMQHQIPQQQMSQQKSHILSESAHPFACIFHCLFKALALVLYMFGGWFADDTKGKFDGANFITLTVILILLLAADFWVVKNITGRLLVGLRWWNKVDGETTRWIFESAPDGSRVQNKFDHWVFWTVLYATPLVWAVLFLGGLLKFAFGWLITVSMGMALSGANLYGYWKCSSDQKRQLQEMVSRSAEYGVSSALRSNYFMSLLTGKKSDIGSATQGQQQPQQNVV